LALKLACECQFSKKEESGEFFLKNFGGHTIKKEEFSFVVE
jgi:hypothetical protein